MISRCAYALGLILATTTLVACGSSSGSSGGSAGPSFIAPSTPDGLPSIRTSPFPTVPVNTNDPAVVQCIKDVAAVTDATELFNKQHGYYAPDMKALVAAGLLKAVPQAVHYGYDAPNIDPVVIGTVVGC